MVPEAWKPGNGEVKKTALVVAQSLIQRREQNNPGGTKGWMKL